MARESKGKLKVSSAIFMALMLTLGVETSASSATFPEIVLSGVDNGRELTLDENYVVAINLPANMSTGYRWHVAELDQTVVRHLELGEFMSDSDRLGSSGTQVLRFGAIGSGVTNLRLVYKRSWEALAWSDPTFSISISTQGPFTGRYAVSFSTEGNVPNADTVVTRSAPSSFNWCDPSHGGCTPINNQHDCGSCWAMATIGVMESNILIQDGKLVDLSPQYLVSCNVEGWNCDNGALPAFEYYKSKYAFNETEAGAVYEADFPDTSDDEVACGPAHPHHEKVPRWEQVPNTVDDIKEAIRLYGPVFATVCAGDAFQGYEDGVFQTNESCKNKKGEIIATNHAVVLVGWDDSQGVWFLANSWGDDWGENGGYMRIKYGTSNVGSYVAKIVRFTPAPGDDWDGDSIPNELDNCPDVPNLEQTDHDSDGLGNDCDNCTQLASANQLDYDRDGFGDVCDICPHVFNPRQSEKDSDGDALPDECDNCPLVFNPNQLDGDVDGAGDVCDICPRTFNPDQDPSDSDGDGAPNVCDICPCDAEETDPDLQGDKDGACDRCNGSGAYCERYCSIFQPDNCPTAKNRDQANTNALSEQLNSAAVLGDACEQVPTPQLRIADASPSAIARPTLDLAKGLQYKCYERSGDFRVSYLGTRDLNGAGPSQGPVTVPATYYRYCVDVPGLSIFCDRRESRPPDMVPGAHCRM